MDDNALIPFPNQPSSMAIHRQQLERAMTLVRNGQREEAYKISVQVLKENRNNADAIWIYANLTPSKEKAIAALKKLLELEPGHAKAMKLLGQLTDDDDDDVFGVGDETSRTVKTSVSVTSEPKQAEPDQSQLMMQQLLLQQQMLLEQQRRQAQQPSVYINNQNTNTPIANAFASAAVYRPPIAQQERNNTAFMLGLIAGTFGFFGVAHILNGKVGTGILLLLAGFVWGGIFLGIAVTGIGCIGLILHIVMTYYQADSGAKRIVYV